MQLDFMCSLKLFIDFNYFCFRFHIESRKKIETFAGTKGKMFCVKRYLCSTKFGMKGHKEIRNIFPLFKNSRNDAENLGQKRLVP